MNPTPSLNESYLWIPEVSDNVVPGLDSMITYTQSKYATLTALQNAITNIINNIQIESCIIQNHYFTYQRKGSQELQIQLSKVIVADLQNQINNITSGSGGSDPNEPEVGTM